ncbi:unnamed protein product [Miscanthus lutarioriparius]|uniref:BPM/SPOP BACK domain-containing protein n=1 Tax=Miscanthus lutarioriparius TaxID=422564 RepID=A0A811R6Y3_9POAL|nr:unnamed protein product [Miscanthus lutarioriparius]
MQPDVFRAMLYFVYTDSMDHHDDLSRDYYSKNCDMNVATTLALADQHHCDKLKHACVEFMCCSDNAQDVVATQGYMDLAKTSPSVLADAMARMSKISKKVMTRALQAQDASSI